jgi:DNA-binding protein HU-beta
MSESELVSRMAAAPAGAELTKVGIKALVNTLFEEVTKALTAGEEFTFGGFGRFHVTGTKERVGRDPRTGVQLLVPAKKVVKFKPHTFLRDTVMPPAPKVEIYRDLRDFQGILGAHAAGNGYGYDASIGGWDGSLAHGSEYDAARMLSATGPSVNKINVRFGDDYVNSLGNAPVNRAAFQRGNYYVWLLLLGGSGTPAGTHSVKIGDNSEVVVSSGPQPDSPIWQQAGNGLYMIQGGTPIELSFLAPDGAIHAVVAICLKNSPGAPGQMPAGNGGDMLVTLQ